MKASFLSSPTLKSNYNVYQKQALFALCMFFVITTNPVYAIHFENTIQDGTLIRGKLEHNEILWVNNKRVHKNTNGLFYFGIPQNKKNITLKIKRILKHQDDTLQSKTFDIEKIKLDVKQRNWNTTVVNGLPQSKVTISAKNQERINKENLILKNKREIFDDNYFPICFQRPIQKNKYRISGNFGSRRMLNGTIGVGHSGTDYAAPIGTEIFSIADGKIETVHQDMFLSGKTVLINHGHGLFSSYSHLNHIHIKEGDLIKKGDIVGTVGKTGRATGPHLHFTTTWFDTRIDPEQLFNDFPCQTPNESN